MTLSRSQFHENERLLTLVPGVPVRLSLLSAATALLLWRIAGAWTFHSLIHIWNVQGDGIGLAACAKFFLSLFGI